MTNLPSSTGSGDLDNIAVTRAEFRAEIGLLLEYLAQALGDVGGDYTSEDVIPTEVILQGTPTIEAGANPATDSVNQRIPSTKWVKESGNYVNSSAYGAPVDGQLWVDTSTNPYSLKAYNSGENDWDLLSGFPSGTRMLFQQETAPTGWTKDTANNNMALRVTSGAPSVVDSNQPFTTVFSQTTTGGTVAGTALGISQLPAHKHGISDPGHSHSCSVSDPGHRHGFNAARADGDTEAGNGDDEARNKDQNTKTATTGISVSANAAASRITIQNTGSGQTHTHGFTGGSIDLRINYVDVIVAEKD